MFALCLDAIIDALNNPSVPVTYALVDNLIVSFILTKSWQWSQIFLVFFAASFKHKPANLKISPLSVLVDWNIVKSKVDIKNYSLTI